MGLSGIEIMKMLPKKNCGECGVPTCLAFAMKVAAGQADINACPHASDEVKAKISEASAPPIRTIKLGSGDNTFEMGGETCLYRHEKRFEHPTGICVLVSTDMSEDDIAGRLSRFNTLRYDRVGVLMKADLIAIKDRGDKSAFTSLVERVRGECPDACLILMSEDPDTLSEGAKICADHKPLLYAATKDNADKMVEVAKDAKCPLCVKGDTIGETASLAEKISEDYKDLVLDTGARTLRAVLEDQILIRRASIKHKVRSVGFPTVTFPCEMTDDLMVESMIASVLVAKYAGIVVLSDLQPDTVYPLFLERLNIFTDPQRPMVVQEDIYPINGPDENSPVLITCNFSLTYFIVSGEVEGSKVPSWLLIKDTEGLSVLTAWAAGKFSADLIAAFVKKCGIADKVSHRCLIIPGYLASLKGELEEELPDWTIQIGPREASHLPAFLREWQPS